MSTTAGEGELTVREAARAVHRAEETIRRWIWAGKLPARRLRDGYRVHASDVTAVAGHRPLPGTRLAARPNLAEWVADVSSWRAGSSVPPHGGAGQLVLEDRAERAEIGRR